MRQVHHIQLPGEDQYRQVVDEAAREQIEALQEAKQDKLVAGANIVIDGNTISAQDAYDDTGVKADIKALNDAMLRVDDADVDEVELVEKSDLVPIATQISAVQGRVSNLERRPSGQTYDDTEIREGLAKLQSDIVQQAEVLDSKLTAPTSVEVGQYFRVASIDSEGNPVLEVVDLPIATDSVAGVAKVRTAYGVSVINDCLRVAPFSPVTYAKTYNTRKNGEYAIKLMQSDDAVRYILSDTTAPAWSAEQQAAAQQRLGINKEWVLKGTLTTENKDTGVTVDLNGCTELMMHGNAIGTANVILTTNVTSLYYGFVGNGATTVLTYAQNDMLGQHSTFFGKSSGYNSQTVVNNNLASSYAWVNGKHVNDITRIYFNNPQTITEIDIKIYAR